MIKLLELSNTDKMHKFWSTLLDFMKTINRIDDKKVRNELYKLEKKLPSTGAMINSKYDKVQIAFGKYKQELEKFNNYVRDKSY